MRCPFLSASNPFATPKRALACAIIAVCSLAASSAMAQVLVYDNTDTYAGSRSFTQLQIGDEIDLSGSERTITKLIVGLTQQGFEGTGDVQAWIYENDGRDGAPETMLWESDLMTGVRFSGGDDLIPFDVPNITVPDKFTWTVQISNTTPVAVGLPHYGPPSVGSSPDYAWFGDGTSWTRLTNSGRPVNFMCQVYAASGAGPQLTVDFSSCPTGGPIQVSWSDATPNSSVVLIMADSTGSLKVPNNRPCAGTTLGLSAAGIRVVFTGKSSGDGGRTLNANAPRGICGNYLQLLDLVTCKTSNVARIE